MLAALECIALISWICCTDTLLRDTVAASRNVWRKSEFSINKRYCVNVACIAHALLCTYRVLRMRYCVYVSCIAHALLCVSNVYCACATVCTYLYCACATVCK